MLDSVRRVFLSLHRTRRAFTRIRLYTRRQAIAPRMEGLNSMNKQRTRSYFVNGIETDLDEIKAIKAARNIARRESQARMKREAVKGSIWAFVGFVFCLALLVMA